MSGSTPQKSSNPTYALNTKNSTHGTRDLLSKDLAGKEVFEMPILDHYLKAKTLPMDWVTECREYLSRLETVKTAVDELKKLQGNSSVQYADVFVDAKRPRQELKMYPHLLRIMNAIAEFANSSRTFRDSHKDSGTFEDGFPGFSPLQPDLIMEEKTQVVPNSSRGLLWRNVLCCIEVKFDGNLGPIRQREPSSDATPQVKASVAQAADYARLHMSCRPFQLFSIGILIFASSFTVSVYDRGGILHSVQMQMYDDRGVTDDFIRTIRLLAVEATEVDLGRDPTVTALETTGPAEYPTYRVGLSSSLSYDSSPQWTTTGRPIWSSYTLLGRGTSVWRIKPEDSAGTHKERILKTAWRPKTRDGEAEIYKYMKEHHIDGSPGIATFQAGQDVVFEHPVSKRETTVSVNALRPRDAAAQLPVDIVLHRVVLKSVGKPLWEYDTPIQFVQALLAVVQGMRTLLEHRILHRDISAGNVLLSADPRPGYEAFLADFELAKIQDQVKPVPTITSRQVHVIHMQNERQVPDNVKTTHIEWTDQISNIPGPDMTGTLQFMSVDMLLNCFEIQPGVGYPPSYVPKVHAIHHELESLVYVAEYALFRKAYQAVIHLPPRDQRRKDIEIIFATEFGFGTVYELVNRRLLTAFQPRLPTTPLQRMSPHLDASLVALIQDLLDLVSAQHVDESKVKTAGSRTALRKLMTCDEVEEQLRQYLH